MAIKPTTIALICPTCGATVHHKMSPDIQFKMISCSVCKQTYKFSEYKPAAPSKISKSMGSAEDDVTRYGEGDSVTSISDTSNYTIGALKELSSSRVYQLLEGRNIVGRKAATSKATIQIETTDMQMSRSHAVIEVVSSGNGYKHYFLNVDTKKNPTYIDGSLVDNVDKIILNGGEKLKMAQTTFVFTMSNGDDTVL